MILKRLELEDLIHYLKEFKYIDKNISFYDIEEKLEQVEDIEIVEA